MVTKNQIKKIKSLRLKKNRLQLGWFCVEGLKIVKDFLNQNNTLVVLYTTENQVHHFKDYSTPSKIVVTSQKVLDQISNLTNAPEVIAVFEQKQPDLPNSTTLGNNTSFLVLDGIQDPGNLGTIIRLADWFGITNIICSLHTTDCYATKVVQASMGSLARVSIKYQNLSDFFTKNKLPVYGAFLEGKRSIDVAIANKEAYVLVMGSEAHGISSEIEAFVTQKITIPKSNRDSNIESLNVASATAILLSQFSV